LSFLHSYSSRNHIRILERNAKNKNNKNNKNNKLRDVKREQRDSITATSKDAPIAPCSMRCSLH
jgi:hypothetical protein